MKKNNQVSTIKQTFDLAKFDKDVRQDTDTIPSLIMKIKITNFFAVLPDWIDRYVVPPGTVQSHLAPAKCMARLLVLQKEQCVGIHPIHQLDIAVSTSDVAVSNVGATYVSEKKKENLTVVMGYLLPNPKDALRIVHANTAEVIATDAKMDKNGNVVVPEWPENYKVPVSEAVVSRESTGSTVSSRSRARDEIFNFLTAPQNIVSTLALHNRIGESVGNYKTNAKMLDTLIKYYKATKTPIPSDLDCRTMTVDNSPVPCSSVIATAYQYYFKSVSIRGGREGKSLSHGFERFCMSRTMSNTLNFVLDVINMSELFGSKVMVTHDSSDLTKEQTRVLIKNGISVVNPHFFGDKWTQGCTPGFYATIDKNENYFEFLPFSDEHVRPALSAGVITMGKYYEAALNKLSLRKRVFSYVYMDRRLGDYSELNLLPSATADTMMVIAAKGAGRSYGLDELVKRSTMAISCRNRFLHCRKTFATMDMCGDFVRWDREIIYPAMRVVEKGKFLELDEHAPEPTTDLHVEGVPLHNSYFASSVAYYIAAATTIDALFEEAYNWGPMYLFKMYSSVILKKGKFDFVEDGGASWPAKFDRLLDIKESVFIRLLSSIDPHAKEEYNKLLDSLVPESDAEEGGEEDEGDFDLLGDDVPVKNVAPQEIKYEPDALALFEEDFFG